MPLVVKRRPKENNSRLVHRFNRESRRSGIVNEARSRRFFKKPLNKTAKKKAALRRKELKEEYKRKEKLGELK